MSGKAVLGEGRDSREPKGSVMPIKVTREGAEQTRDVDRSKKYHFKEGRMYTHPPRKLLSGSIDYNCRLFGAVQVSQSTGSHTVKDAVDQLGARKKALGSAGTILPEVELSVSVRGITVTDPRTKMRLHQHPIHHISFCAEDRRSSPNFITYIVRTKTSGHMCFVFQAMDDNQTDAISSTIGEAFEVAFEKYQDAKTAQKEFAELKANLRTSSEKEEFAKQLHRVHREAQTIEAESRIRPKPKKFPNTVAKWDSIATSLEPFAMEPSMKPDLLHLVPRPQTQELDTAISFIEEQLKELDEGFAELWTVKKLTGPKAGESDIHQAVMSEIEGQIQDIREQSEALEEPELPVNYQMDEYTKARIGAVLPKAGTVKEAASSWPPAEDGK